MPAESKDLLKIFSVIVPPPQISVIYIMVQIIFTWKVCLLVFQLLNIP